MNFPLYEDIASMCYFLCIFCQEFVLTLSNYELLFVRSHSIYKEGICTRIFIPGFRSISVVQEYEQEELADNSEDEKRITKAQEKAYRKEHQMATTADKSGFGPVLFSLH